MLPSCKLDPLIHDISNYIDTNPYLGYKCENKLNQLKIDNIMSSNDEKIFRERCTKFLYKLYVQLKQKVPDNIKILEKISFFSVHNILKHQKSPIISLLKFWHEVSCYRNANNENPFKDLCNLALTFLVLPFSNAEMERIFSQLNLVKNKVRNKISLNMVNAILTIRYGLRRYDKCCHNYDVDEKTLSIIGTNDSYPQKHENYDFNYFLKNYN
ncbi:hypothetical protein ALC57_08796 [Trachymyrmex cornetzi]|uniref:HAT C-terminal dimerisation domain-containing protein n=1 Tax=Trachymyrmex cornetzi TaxID=471704 RepID=A0A151J6T4_9HYME|nr:hypothetical protein ALC57_08796 [Trachymyrmex cornetzi]